MRASTFGVVLLMTSFSANGQMAKGDHAELALTYSGLRGNVVQGESFWSQGGALAMSAEFYRGLSVVVEGFGAHSQGAGKYAVPYDTVSITFGPRLTLPVPHLRHAVSVFGQGLVGEVHGINGVFPSPLGADSTALAAATEAGGGVDLRLRRHLAARVIQADWIRTQLPNGTTSVQNSLRLGAGLVWRIQ